MPKERVLTDLRRPVRPAPRALKLAVSALFGLVLRGFPIALVLGAYNCSTERPARELFFDPPDTER